LVSINTYIDKRWGGQDLGCYGVRAVRDGEKWSDHAFGAARDRRYVNPGPGRAVLLDEILPFLIEHSDELGIQAIHDYAGGRIWRSDRGDGKGAYWKDQPKSGAMGASWAGWVHIAVHAGAWFDGRSVEDKIAGVLVPKPTLRLGDKGPEVLRLNEWLLLCKFTPSDPRPTFDRRTRVGVKRMQRAVGFPRRDRDGVYGPKTAAAFEAWLVAK
jgi:hypothetical protein